MKILYMKVERTMSKLFLDYAQQEAVHPGPLVEEQHSWTFHLVSVPHWIYHMAHPIPSAI